MKIKINYHNTKTGRDGSFIESLPDYIDASNVGEVSDYIRNVHLSDEKVLTDWKPASKSTKRSSTVTLKPLTCGHCGRSTYDGEEIEGEFVCNDCAEEWREGGGEW